MMVLCKRRERPCKTGHRRTPAHRQTFFHKGRRAGLLALKPGWLDPPAHTVSSVTSDFISVAICPVHNCCLLRVIFYIMLFSHHHHFTSRVFRFNDHFTKGLHPTISTETCKFTNGSQFETLNQTSLIELINGLQSIHCKLLCLS